MRNCMLLLILFPSVLVAKLNINITLSPDKKNKSTLTPAARWEEIHILWYNKFNPKKPNKAILLRQKNYAYKHGLVPNHYNNTWTGIHGLNTKKVFISSVKPLSTVRNLALQQTGKNSNRVTGIYIHDSNNVKTWKFVNGKGYITTIHATSNHPFYVKNIGEFLPLQQITPNMELTDDHQHTLHLICASREHKKCGYPYNVNKISTVYNIEVNQQHQYFVSGKHILVHNCSRSAVHNQAGATKIYDLDSRIKAASVNSDHLIVSSNIVQCMGFPGCLYTSISIFDINPSAEATYHYPDEIPLGKYKKILMDRVPEPDARLLLSHIGEKVESGTRAYILEEYDKFSAFEHMHDIRNFTFSRLMGIEEGHEVLDGFDGLEVGDLEGSYFFITGEKELKETKNKLSKKKLPLGGSHDLSKNCALLEYIRI